MDAAERIAAALQHREPDRTPLFEYMLLPPMASRLLGRPSTGKFAQLLPATHAMNAFNRLAMGGVADFWPWGSVILLLASGLLAFALAVYLFSWDSRNTARRGHPLLALLVLLPHVAGLVLLS